MQTFRACRCWRSRATSSGRRSRARVRRSRSLPAPCTTPTSPSSTRCAAEAASATDTAPLRVLRFPRLQIAELLQWHSHAAGRCCAGRCQRSQRIAGVPVSQAAHAGGHGRLSGHRLELCQMGGASLSACPADVVNCAIALEVSHKPLRGLLR